MFFGSDRFVVSGPNSDDHFATHPAIIRVLVTLSSKASIARAASKRSVIPAPILGGVKSGRPKRRDCTRLNRTGINILRQ